jgi:hypothetical protein
MLSSGMLPRPKHPFAFDFARFASLAILGLFLAFPLVGCDSAGSSGAGNEDDSDPTTGSSPVDGFTSQAAPIVVDGKGDDWSGLSERYDDTGDGNIGIERLWMAHTEQHLFLRLMVGRPIDLLEDNELTLYLDTDNDPTTGEAALGLGAELQWTFGQRTGRLGNGQAVSHDDIGIIPLPTVRAETFELALDRSVEPGREALFSGDSLRVGLSSEGDRLPDEDGGLGYRFSTTEVAADAPSIDRPAASDIRLFTYNVQRNSIFDAGRQPNHRRISAQPTQMSSGSRRWLRRPPRPSKSRRRTSISRTHGTGRRSAAISYWGVVIPSRIRTGSLGPKPPPAGLFFSIPRTSWAKS